MKILEIKDVVKDYGSLRAVDHVSFDIEKGEVFGLLGPNGAGKTTLISTIVTLEKLTQGQIFVDGYDVKKQERKVKSLIGFMPQELIIHGYFTVKEVVKFYSGFCGVKPDEERIDYLLHKLSLWDKKDAKVRSLSGGMKRRLLMVKALVHSPNLLILDEPTAGVDLDLREAIWSFVGELKKEGMSILFTTHYLEEAEKLCDRVAFIHRGKLAYMGKTGELISGFTDRKIMLKLKKPKIFTNKQYLGQEKGYEVFALPYSVGLGEFISSLSLEASSIKDIKIKEGSLEDVFKKTLEIK